MRARPARKKENHGTRHNCAYEIYKGFFFVVSSLQQCSSPPSSILRRSDGDVEDDDGVEEETTAAALSIVFLATIRTSMIRICGLWEDKRVTWDSFTQLKK